MKCSRAKVVNRRPIDAGIVRIGSGQHAALWPSRTVSCRQRGCWTICTWSPHRIAAIHHRVETELWEHARIRINQGKTQLWNWGGTLRPRCEHIIEAGRRAHPPVTLWRGDLSLPVEEQGIRVLGTLLGHREFVEADVLHTSEEHTTLLDRIEAVPDLQCAWLILLFCAAARANYLLRVVHPSWSEAFAVRHDAALWKCLCGLLDIRGTGNARQSQPLPVKRSVGTSKRH